MLAKIPFHNLAEVVEEIEIIRALTNGAMLAVRSCDFYAGDKNSIVEILDLSIERMKVVESALDSEKVTSLGLVLRDTAGSSAG